MRQCLHLVREAEAKVLLINRIMKHFHNIKVMCRSLLAELLQLSLILKMKLGSYLDTAFILASIWIVVQPLYTLHNFLVHPVYKWFMLCYWAVLSRTFKNMNFVICISLMKPPVPWFPHDKRCSNSIVLKLYSRTMMFQFSTMFILNVPTRNAGSLSIAER